MKYTKLLVAIAACCALAAIVYYISSGNNAVTSVPPDKPPENQTEAVRPNPQPAPEPKQEPEREPENDMDAGELGNKLNEILLSAAEYYNDTINTTQIITQDGFLYNAAADITITPEYLVKMEYLSGDYMVDGAAVLYAAPIDVSEIVHAYENYSEDLKVYAAIPYENGYLLDAKGEPQAVISNEDFEELLRPYNTEHGEIRRITGSSSEYSEINALIKEQRSLTNDLYIRYGMRDDKYAVLIVSPKDNYTSIYQYVLVNENGKWTIRIPNLETVSKTKVVANNVFFDMSVELMPCYEVNSYVGFMETDFGGVNEALIRDGYLTEGDAVLKYISAADRFLFAKYLNGQMFVGIKINDTWVLGEVDSPESALGRMKSVDEKAPDFVIIWE